MITLQQVTLQPITIKFEHIQEFDVEPYLEWCEDYGIEPSQKHYKKWAVEHLVDSLMDDIDTDEFQFIYDEPREIEYKGFELPHHKLPHQELFSYRDYVSDLTEEELQEFHNLCETDKMVLSPAYCKGNIITMNSCDNPKISYGMIVDEEGEIVVIKKSTNLHHIFCYLKQLKDTSQTAPQEHTDPS
jgi:hypothetical protein